MDTSPLFNFSSVTCCHMRATLRMSNEQDAQSRCLLFWEFQLNCSGCKGGCFIPLFSTFTIALSLPCLHLIIQAETGSFTRTVPTRISHKTRQQWRCGIACSILRLANYSVWQLKQLFLLLLMPLLLHWIPFFGLWILLISLPYFYCSTLSTFISTSPALHAATPAPTLTSSGSTTPVLSDTLST